MSTATSNELPEIPHVPAVRVFAYRDTASFGRRQEYVVAAELLKRGFDVYMTLVDDQGIDCIVRLDEHRYVDIQIKARSKGAKNWNRFAAMSFTPRMNLFFILYVERTDRLWIIPSVSLGQIARCNKTGANAGCFTIDLPTLSTGGKHERLARYERDAGFDLLKRYPRL